MGHSGSALYPRGLTKEEVIDQLKPIATMYHAFLRQEHVISSFLHNSKLSPHKEISPKHTPQLLASLVLGCYEQLDNIQEILETLISISQDENNPLVTELNHQFDLYTILANARFSIINSVTNFELKSFCPFSEASSREELPPLDFMTLEFVLKTCLKEKFKIKNPSNDTIRVFKHFSHFTPASSFPPPSAEYLPQGVGNVEPFSARKVMVHGVCSNGQFLFVLCRDTLQIFPILNMGSLMHPFTREMNIRPDPHRSIVADSTHLRIYLNEQCYEYSIFDLLQKNLNNCVQKSVNPNYICYVSDGIVTARIENDFHVSIIEGNKIVRKIKLIPGYSQLHPSIPNLFPHTDYDLIPIEINGCYLSFMYRINPVNIVYRVFSLISGMHLYDDLFTSSDVCYASNTDTINRCHWVISLVEGNKFGVRRFFFPGSIDPRLVDITLKPKKLRKKKYEKFISNFNDTVMHYIGSQIYPKLYAATIMEEFNSFLNLIFQYIEVKNQDLAVQSMIIVLDLNLKRFKPQPSIRDTLIELIPKLPENLRVFLFFGSLNHFLYEYKPAAISMLVDIVHKTKSPALLQYLFHQLESSYCLSGIPFNEQNAFTNLIPSDTRLESDVPVQLQTLILIHQRILTTASLHYVQNEIINEIEFCAREEHKTPLDHLSQYSIFLLNNVHKVLENIKTDAEIDRSYLIFLTSNFLKLLSSLSTNHIVAQFITDIFASLLQKVNAYVTSKSLDLTTDSLIAGNIRLFLFAYGKLAATLLKGTQLTQFEKKFIHIIRSNIEASEKIINPDLHHISRRYKRFLKKKAFYDPIMALIYRTYKPFMHKNLNKDLKSFDRTILLAICRHLSIEDELFELKVPFGAKMKSAIEQMLKVRNSCRLLLQSSQSCDYKNKAIMLLKMKRDKEVTPIELNEFICCKETPEAILNLLIKQKIRTALTIKGFSLMKTILSLKSNSIFIDVLSYNLAQIEKFDGLASTLLIIHGVKLKEIESLFETIMSIINDRPKSNLILAGFRFFRDCHNFNELQNKFFDGSMNIFSKNCNNYAIFGLCLSLISSIKSLPSALSEPQQSPMGWLLQSVALKHVQATKDFFVGFQDVFWNCQPVLKRILCRVMFRVLNSTLIDEETVKNEFNKIIEFIGQTFIDFSDIATANEMIWLMRRFLVEKTYSRSTLMDIILHVDHDDDVKVCGVFAILGNSIELIRPYCNIRSHNNRTSVSEYIAIPTSQKAQFFCYERPFDLNKQPFNLKVTPQNLIYAIPLVTLDNSTFNDYDFILSFFDDCFENLAQIRSMLYMQLLGHFMKYKDFVSKITPQMISMLSLSPLPFHTIPPIIGLIRGFQKMPDLEMVDGFYQIQFHSLNFISFISPQLKPDQKFDLTFEVDDMDTTFYFGIISDDIKRYDTRYSVVSSPEGIVYPYKEQLNNFRKSNQITFFINTLDNVFHVGENKISFPRGDFFRVIISVRRNIKVKIYSDEKNFNPHGVPSISESGAIMAENVEPLFTIPRAVERFDKTSLPREIPKYPAITYNNLIEPIPLKTKLSNTFQEPPDYIPIHCGFATQASKKLVDEINRGLFKTISLQWTTICLMRIAIQNPLIIPNPIKLFTLISIPLEPFQTNNFLAKKFPFSLNPVVEDCNSIYLSLEIDAKNAINHLLSFEEIVDKLCLSLLRMSESRTMHLICQPHIMHTFYPRNSFVKNIEIKNKFTMATVNSFNPVLHNSMTIHDKKENLPFIVTKGPTIMTLEDSILSQDFSVFTISQTDNSFTFDTAYEVLLILKNLLYVVTTPNQKFTLKSAFCNMFIAQSPFVLKYLAQIADFLELQLPPTPYDFSDDYLTRLILIGSLLNNVFSDKFSSFLFQESRILGNTMCIELTKHFPEFLSIQPEKPKSSECIVPIVSLDPGTIKSDFALKIRILRLFSRSYSSLVGFPFWEILPYWLRITGAWRSDATSNGKAPNLNEADEIDPSIEPYNSDIMHISNPTGQKISIQIKHVVSARLPASSMVMISNTPLFENARFVNGKALTKNIEITGNHTYLSIFDIPGGWDALRIEFTNWEKYRPPPPEKIDVDAFHDAFVEDMREFAIKWKPEDTEELIMTLPRYALTEPTFSAAEAIAKNCSLSHKFSINVVLLRALIIHQFNYIRTKQKNEVSKSLWESMTSFVSCEDAADDITACITCGKNDSYATFAIDRHAAQRLAVEGRGDYSRSILSQLTVAFKKAGKEHLQCKKRPWKIRFANEQAIDAGGPTRELMTEVASSIFEPTTQVFIPVPNSRTGNGPNKDTFIPFDKNGTRAPDYATIGTYLGIVLRTGFAQDLPFAPIVWKYLAKETITAADIYAIDSALEEQMKNIQTNCELEYTQWQIESWDGTMTILPGHSPGTLVKPEEASQYVHEVIAYRIATLKPMLKVMRTAFRANIGFNTHPLLTGKLLARMAQGSPVIATEHLKAITVVTDYDGLNDPYIVRFWKAIDRFTSDQRRLLLKFVTTLTRPPNSTINPDFRIQIDRMNTRNPDERLPTASTCFNRLHLPPYTTDDICYEKLLYAVQYCQSMENK